MSRTYKKEYTKSKKVSKSCRNNGGCPYCEGNRKHSTNKKLGFLKEQMKEVKKYKQ